MAFWQPGLSKPQQQKPQQLTSSNVSPNKPPQVLSRSVMSMKFMKRKEVEAAPAPAEEINSNTTENVTMMDVVEAQSSSSSVYQKDDTDVFQHLPGRRSFGGVNKVVEFHYQRAFDPTKGRETITKTINDEEMLKRYENMISLPRGPSQGERPKQVTKGKSTTASWQGDQQQTHMTVVKPDKQHSISNNSSISSSKRRQNSGSKKKQKRE